MLAVVNHFSINEDNPDDTISSQDHQNIQKLLNVIAHIVSEEYIMTVKHNPSLFSSSGSVE